MASLIITFKITILYLLIIVAYRLMDKKNINDFHITDLIIILILGNIISFSVIVQKESFINISIIIISFIFLQTIISYLSMKFPKLKYYFDTKPSIIISKGKLNYKEMIKHRYNLDKLLVELKKRDIKSIEDVEYAYLSSNGKISIFDNNKTNDIPLPLILDGNIQYVTLKLINKNDNWIRKTIDKENISLNNIFYAFYKQGRVYIIKKENN